MSQVIDSIHAFSWQTLWRILLALGAVMWIFSLVGGESVRAWHAFLVNFLFFTPLAAGLVVWTAIVMASRGTWMGPAEEVAALGQAFALPSLAALLLLWAGSSAWAPWPRLDPHQRIWLDTTFIFARDFLALAVFWGTALRYRRRRRLLEDKSAAAVLVLVYCLTFSLLGFDLVMALDPHWVSSLFGGYFFISGLYIAMAAWTLIIAWRGRVEKERLHDLGKLLLAFSILTTYMMYCQLIPIYYENLPQETRFLIPRLNYQPWRTVSMFLAGVVFVGPLFLLLTVWAKRNRRYLGSVAGLILVGMWVERWWLVAPTLEPRMSLGLPEAGAALLFLGVLGMCLQVFCRRREEQTGEKIL